MPLAKKGLLSPGAVNGRILSAPRTMQVGLADSQKRILRPLHLLWLAGGVRDGKVAGRTVTSDPLCTVLYARLPTASSPSCGFAVDLQM